MKVIQDIDLETAPFVGRASEVQQAVNGSPMKAFIWDAVEQHFRFVGITPTLEQVGEFVAEELYPWLASRGVVL